MLFLLASLVVGAAVCVIVTGGSLQYGYPIEVAIARGLVGFVGISLLGYAAELVVATAPPQARAAAPREGATRHDAITPLHAVQDESEADADDAMRRAA